VAAVAPSTDAAAAATPEASVAPRAQPISEPAAEAAPAPSVAEAASAPTVAPVASASATPTETPIVVGAPVAAISPAPTETPIVVSAPVAAPAPAPVTPAALAPASATTAAAPADLDRMLEQAGLQWVQTSPEAVAHLPEPTPIAPRAPRVRAARVVADEGPLVQVETRSGGPSA